MPQGAVHPIWRNCWASRWRPATASLGGTAGHPAGAQRRRALTDAVVALAPISRMTAAACAALGVSRATVQRRRAGLAAPAAIPRPRSRPARALSAPQRQEVLDVLHAPDFADQAPAEVYATLLDQGIYLCSIRTMYRFLTEHDEVRERRAQLAELLGIPLAPSDGEP